MAYFLFMITYNDLFFTSLKLNHYTPVKRAVNFFPINITLHELQYHWPWQRLNCYTNRRLLKIKLPQKFGELLGPHITLRVMSVMRQLYNFAPNSFLKNFKTFFTFIFFVVSCKHHNLTHS